MNSEPLFCQFCGGEGFSEVREGSAFKCRQCERVTYLNSKPAVGAVIVQDGNILLVSDCSASTLQSWDLSGGFLLYGETPEAALKREVSEELSVEIEVGGLLAALVDSYGIDRDPCLNLFYEARLISTAIEVGSEVLDYGWFGLNGLPRMKYKSTFQVLSSLDRYLRKGWQNGE